MSTLYQASDFVPSEPRALATVSTADVIALPTGWAGKFAWFQAVAGSGSAVDVFVRFGTDNTVSVDSTTETVLTGEDLDPSTDEPDLHLVAGLPAVRVRIPPTATHFAHIASATTGRLRFGLATGTG